MEVKSEGSINLCKYFNIHLYGRRLNSSSWKRGNILFIEHKFLLVLQLLSTLQSAATHRHFAVQPDSGIYTGLQNKLGHCPSWTIIKAENRYCVAMSLYIHLFCTQLIRLTHVGSLSLFDPHQHNVLAAHSSLSCGVVFDVGGRVIS